MATHSSVLAWRIPGTGESGGVLSMGSHRVGHDWSNLAAAAAAAVYNKRIDSQSIFLKRKKNETTKKIWLTFYFCFQYSINHGFLKRLNLSLFINILRFIKSKVALWRIWIVWKGHIREIWINHNLILKTLLTLLQIYCSKGSYFIFKYICVSNCVWENTLWSLLGWLGFFKLPLYVSGSKALELIFLLLADFFFFFLGNFIQHFDPISLFLVILIILK